MGISLDAVLDAANDGIVLIGTIMSWLNWISKQNKYRILLHMEYEHWELLPELFSVAVVLLTSVIQKNYHKFPNRS